MRVVITQPNVRREDGGSNITHVERLLLPLKGRLGTSDVVLLPELVGGDTKSEDYEREVKSLASRLGAWVVGGSHFARQDRETTNTGVVANPYGEIAGRYGKLNPYGDERARVTKPGCGPLLIQIGEVSCLVMICADFWHSTAFSQADTAPDLILVPAFSASQRSEPQMARARWRHAAVARAYEFTVFVAVSDWAHPVGFGTGLSSGAAGLAHPNPSSPGGLYRPLARRRFANLNWTWAPSTNCAPIAPTEALS